MLVETYLICQKIQEQYQLIEKYESGEFKFESNESNEFDTSNQTTLTPEEAKTAAGTAIIILILALIAVISLYVWAIVLLVKYGKYCEWMQDPGNRFYQGQFLSLSPS